MSVEVELHPTLDDLRSIDVFHDLPTESLQWLAERMELRENKAGDLVIKAGTPADYLYAIVTGEIRGERPDTGGVFTAPAGTVRVTPSIARTPE